MYALRFFIGLLEACAFPGYIAILGSWYGPQELAKRTAVLLEVESIASMFSGYLQAGLHSSMNGTAGLAGWQWLFIMDGVISIPIALWGFFGLPDMPHNTRAFYWSAEVSLAGPVLDVIVADFWVAHSLWHQSSREIRPQRPRQADTQRDQTNLLELEVVDLRCILRVSNFVQTLNSLNQSLTNFIA
jgi:MFS family permease